MLQMKVARLFFKECIENAFQSYIQYLHDTLSYPNIENKGQGLNVSILFAHYFLNWYTFSSIIVYIFQNICI